MHFRAGVVERGDAEEHVVLLLAMVVLLGAAGIDERLVRVENRLWEPGRAGGEVDRRVVVLFDRHSGRDGRAIGDKPVVAVREIGTFLANVEPVFYARQIFPDRVHAGDEFLTEHEHIHVGKLGAVADLLGGVAVIHRNGKRAGFQDPEIDRQPFQTVHE